MLLNYHIGLFLLSSLCVGDLVRLGLGSVCVAGFSREYVACLGNVQYVACLGNVQYVACLGNVQYEHKVLIL